MHAGEVDQVLALPFGEAASLITQIPESQWFDRKSGKVAPRDLAITLVAFANAEGGTVVVGTHGGDVEGVAPRRTNDLRQAAFDFTTPAVRADVDEIAIPGTDRALMIFRISPGERVHETNRGECYLRVGDESRRLTFGQRQELEYDRGNAPFDGSPIRAGTRDLDQAQMAAYAKALGSSGTASMLRARNLLTPDGELTVAGYLLFSDHPQQLFPAAHVRVLRYGASERGTGSRLTLEDDADLRFEGSIPQQITGAAEAIERLVPRRRVLGPSGRFEALPIIPREAWLEALVNAVIHRSYSIAGDSVRIEIFPDRIEIASPGRFPGLVDPTRPESIARHARNPRIARVCSDLGIAQELGEGIQRIFDEMRLRGLTEPLYTQTSASVKLALSSADAMPQEIREALAPHALDALNLLRRAGRPLGTGQVADLAGITRPTAGRYLQALREAGLVTWEGTSPRDPRATWRLL